MKCRWVDKEAWTKEYFKYFGIILYFFMLSPKMLRYLVMFCFLESISQKKIQLPTRAKKLGLTDNIWGKVWKQVNSGTQGSNVKNPVLPQPRAGALGGTRTQELLVTKYWAMDMGNRDRGGRCARLCVIKEGQKNLCEEWINMEGPKVGDHAISYSTFWNSI